MDTSVRGSVDFALFNTDEVRFYITTTLQEEMLSVDITNINDSNNHFVAVYTEGVGSEIFINRCICWYTGVHRINVTIYTGTI